MAVVYSIAVATAAARIASDGADAANVAGGRDETGTQRDTSACAKVLVAELPYAKASAREKL